MMNAFNLKEIVHKPTEYSALDKLADKEIDTTNLENISDVKKEDSQVDNYSKLDQLADNEIKTDLKDNQSLEKSSYLPESDGIWDGEKGNSTFIPNPDVVPKKPLGNAESWGDILKKHGVDGIGFENGEPDFSPVSEGSVTIDEFTEDRNSNFTQADEKLANQWTSEGKDNKVWTAQDIKEYRKEYKLSWHERSDTQTLDLVPQSIHANIPHSGGISVIKNQQKV